MCMSEFEKVPLMLKISNFQESRQPILSTINRLRQHIHLNITSGPKWSAQGLTFFALFLLPPASCLAMQPLGCLIEPERTAEVGSPVIGVVESVLVERGDTVSKGQVIAILRADVERASVQVAHIRTKAEADVRTAQANLNLARSSQKRGEDLVGKKYISEQALEKLRADSAMAEQKLALAREQLHLWDAELGLARAQLGQRSIRSPLDGIVAERYIWPGERVEEKALFKIAKIDPLRVEMVMPVSLYGSLVKDMLITVSPEMPNAQLLQAKVVLVDKLFDGASNTFRVRAEIPNPSLAIPSGLRCRVDVPEPRKTSAQAPLTIQNGPAVPPPPGTTVPEIKAGPQFKRAVDKEGVATQRNI